MGLRAASTDRRRATAAGPSPRPRRAAGRRAGPTSRTSAPARPGRARGPAAGPAHGPDPGRRRDRPARPVGAVARRAAPGSARGSTTVDVDAGRTRSAVDLLALAAGEHRWARSTSHAAAVSRPAGSRGEVTSRTIRPAMNVSFSRARPRRDVLCVGCCSGSTSAARDRSLSLSRATSGRPYRGLTVTWDFLMPSRSMLRTPRSVAKSWRLLAETPAGTVPRACRARRAGDLDARRYSSRSRRRSARPGWRAPG